jgi:hypothetical protein
MRAHSSPYLAALAMLVGALGCASTMAKPDDSPSAAARDTTSTTTASDTGSVQNPPGYRGMERDTSMVPPGATTQPVDTFLQRQGTGAPQDTMGYGGLERDTTGQQQQRETENPSDSTGRTVPGMAQQDSTSGMGGMDSTGGMGGMDSMTTDTSGMSGMGSDSTSAR